MNWRFTKKIFSFFLKKSIDKTVFIVYNRAKKTREEIKKMTSQHYTNDRERREALIQMIGYGEIIKTVEIDRGHRNGPEIHKVSTTGIVTIYNKRSGVMITKLIARPNQIRRYFEGGNAPAELLNIARDHQRLGYNEA